MIPKVTMPIWKVKGCCPASCGDQTPILSIKILATMTSWAGERAPPPRPWCERAIPGWVKEWCGGGVQYLQTGLLARHFKHYRTGVSWCGFIAYHYSLGVPTFLPVGLVQP